MVIAHWETKIDEVMTFLVKHEKYLLIFEFCFTAKTAYSLNFDARRPDHPMGQIHTWSLMQGVPKGNKSPLGCPKEWVTFKKVVHNSEIYVTFNMSDFSHDPLKFEGSCQREVLRASFWKITQQFCALKIFNTENLVLIGQKMCPSPLQRVGLRKMHLFWLCP